MSTNNLQHEEKRHGQQAGTVMLFASRTRVDKCFTIAGAAMQVMRECEWLNESRHLECSEIRACVSVSTGLISPDYTDSSAIRLRAFRATKPNAQRNINAPAEQQTSGKQIARCQALSPSYTTITAA